MERTTPDNITALKPNEVFVFGSNMAGHHAGGAARTALQWGAVDGVGRGLRGHTYALPTLDARLQQLPPSDIAREVETLFHVAMRNPEFTFLVTEVGCGIAGFAVEEIAPLFAAAIQHNNIHLPVRFWAVLSR